MRRSAPSPGARRAQRVVLAGMTFWSAACAPELEKLEDVRSERGTLGEEVYKMLCRRVAGTEIPDDLDGRKSEVLCLGQADEVAQELEAQQEDLPARLVELVARRAQLVRAVDDVFPDELGDGLEQLMRELLPFYDPPDELIQNGTRAFAGVLRKIAENDGALNGLESLGRGGMIGRDGDLGLYRSMLAYDQLNPLFAAILPVLTEDKGVRPYFETLLTGMALELATTELDDDPDSDTRRLKDLLARTRPEFGSKNALLVAKRDARGLPVPTALGDEPVPYPFVDADDDGRADVVAGRFVADPKFGREIPSPLLALSEESVQRDELGRAYAFTADGKVDRTRFLFELTDVDGTLLAATLREAGKVFHEDTRIAVQLAKIFPALFGKRGDAERRYGKASFAYSAPDTDQSPLLDLVHASTVVLDRPLYEQSLELTQRLLEEEETALVSALEPLLSLEQRTRAGSDAYPEAQLPKDSVFWDEMLFELEKISRRRKSADGPTMLELLLRGALGYARNMDKPGQPVEQLVDPQVLSHDGALLAALMRYKDEWRNNPVGESKREPGEPATIGGFRTPVDRTLPDSPVTCGKDGCGGLVAGTPFEVWAKKGQNCMLQRDGRPASSKDCGAPANQSILQRSLGLIWEMAGRAQCNKTITLRDLLNFAVGKDACKELEQRVACDTTTPGGQAAGDAQCVTAFGNNSDYGCSADSQLCIAKSGSQTCSQLKQQQQQDRQDTVVNGEERLYEDYTCPPNEPGQDPPACDAYRDKYPAAFVDLDGPATGKPSSIEACHLLDLPDVGRSFGRALTHEFLVEIPNPWLRRYLEDVARAGDPSIPDCAPGFQGIKDPYETPDCIPGAASLSRDVYEDMPADVDTLGELVEYLLDDSSLFTNERDLKDLRPNVSALTRVLFAPPGSTSFLMFDPLLVHGAPPGCVDAPTLPVCALDDTAVTPAGGCCIEDLRKPPFRYRLDTYYGTTSFAWEQKVAFKDGTSVSLLEAMNTLADAVNRTDFDPLTDDPKDFEGTDFVFSTLGKIVGEHYDSAENTLAQNTDPNGAHYRTFSGLVKYERLLADALDDGSIDADQAGPHGESLFDAANLPNQPEQHLGLVYKAYPLLEKLSKMTVGDRDGLAFSAALTELLLSPHASCAPEGGDLRVIDGQGACHLAASDDPPPGFRAPLAYRDGRTSICWNDGRCFDKGADRHFASPLYLALDAVGSIRKRLGKDKELQAAYDGVRAGLFDEYLAAEGKLKDRRLRGVMLVALDYLRERWAEEAKDGTLASLGAEITHDTADFLESPVFAGGLGMIEGLSEEPEAMDALNRFAGALLGGTEDEGQLRALLGASSDFLEAMPGNQDLVELLKVMALGVVPNADEVVLGGRAEPELEKGMIWRNLMLLRESAARDDRGVLGQVLNNVASLPGHGTADERASPLAELFDVLIAINRAELGSKATLSAEEWKAVITRIADVMLDERRGFERLYRVVECREGGTDEISCE